MKELEERTWGGWCGWRGWELYIGNSENRMDKVLVGRVIILHYKVISEGSGWDVVGAGLGQGRKVISEASAVAVAEASPRQVRQVISSSNSLPLPAVHPWSVLGCSAR